VSSILLFPSNSVVQSLFEVYSIKYSSIVDPIIHKCDAATMRRSREEDSNRDGIKDALWLTLEIPLEPRQSHICIEYAEYGLMLSIRKRYIHQLRR
jgi:hypothetical protein